MLLLTILDFYHVACNYLFVRFRFYGPNSSLAELVWSLWHTSLGGKLLPIIVVLVACADLMALAFVSALVARHACYMMANITTYEVLVRPLHVQRRFPKNRGHFWFFDGCGPFVCFRNCFNYWTLNTDQDASDFIGPASNPDPSLLDDVGSPSRKGGGSSVQE